MEVEKMQQQLVKKFQELFGEGETFGFIFLPAG